MKRSAQLLNSRGAQWSLHEVEKKDEGRKAIVTP
jgi:hypothetical protein